MKKMIPLAFATVMLAACTSNASDSKVTETDLLHRHFELVSVDGVQVTKDQRQGRIPGIEFGEKMRISGSMCNGFFGQGELKASTLTVEHLASTQMMCADDSLNKWDFLIGQVLKEGAKITLNQGQLTLSNGQHQLVYTQKDWVK